MVNVFLLTLIIGGIVVGESEGMQSLRIVNRVVTMHRTGFCRRSTEISFIPLKITDN